jgi:uncharacterized protein (DUF849 family)
MAEKQAPFDIEARRPNDFYMRIEERIQPAIAFMLELASLNMTSMNFGLFPILERFTEFRHPWERDYLENSRDLVFRNTLGC